MVCLLSIGSGGDGADPAIRGRARRVGHWRRTGLPIRQKSSSTGKPRPIRSPGRADASPLAAAPGEACRVPHGAERRARAGGVPPARDRARLQPSASSATAKSWTKIIERDARPQRKLDENHLEIRRVGGGGRPRACMEPNWAVRLGWGAPKAPTLRRRPAAGRPGRPTGRRFPGWTNGPAGLCLDPGACVLAHTDGRSTAADRDRAET